LPWIEDLFLGAGVLCPRKGVADIRVQYEMVVGIPDAVIQERTVCLGGCV